MLENARNVERHLRERLEGSAGVVEVIGKGCLLGIRFEGKASDVHKRLLASRIITGTSSDPHVLRLLPPLCVPVEEIDLLVEALAL